MWPQPLWTLDEFCGILTWVAAISYQYVFCNNLLTGPSGNAVEGVGLRPLACWDCGFESHRGHGCLSIVSVVWCQVEVSASGWSFVQGSPIECDASLSVIWKPREWEGPVPRGLLHQIKECNLLQNELFEGQITGLVSIRDINRCPRLHNSQISDLCDREVL